jgi:cell division protein FtsI (penicillin-binding protein 3)
VAGKTGTAQKLDPLTGRYSRAPGVLSFVGFAPADDPRIVMLVLLDEPKTAQWGSEAAAPVFAAIGRELLRYLDVPPRDSHMVQIIRADPAPGPPPAEREADSEMITPGREARVIPAGGWAGNGLDVTGQEVMPNLKGRSLREALQTLSAYNVQVEIRGRGVIVSQHPTAGARIQSGIVCRLDLTSPTASQEGRGAAGRAGDGARGAAGGAGDGAPGAAGRVGGQ